MVNSSLVAIVEGPELKACDRFMALVQGLTNNYRKLWVNCFLLLLLIFKGNWFFALHFRWQEGGSEASFLLQSPPHHGGLHSKPASEMPADCALAVAINQDHVGATPAGNPVDKAVEKDHGG
jgi:hypothetical protein